MTEDADAPEGTVWRKVRMSDTLFRILGASLVEWGEPDDEGFYTPTVWIGPDGLAIPIRRAFNNHEEDSDGRTTPA